MTADYNVGVALPSTALERPQAAISWSAVLAGASVAVAASLLLTLAAATEAPARTADQEIAACGRSSLAKGRATPTL